jgi:L-ascorbate metabolism protein UlaG (beta-lactamase superfamily)
MDEIKTWQTWEKEGLKITSVPVLHNGWRYALDHSWMTTSFTGYVVEYKGLAVYIGGDTAYDTTLFKETAKKFNHFNLAILPIAPIHPREYSKARHTDPAEALQITRDLNADYLLPMHYDTFPESLDSLGEAANLMRDEIKRMNIDPERIAILGIGEQRVFIYRRKDKVFTNNRAI